MFVYILKTGAPADSELKAFCAKRGGSPVASFFRTETLPGNGAALLLELQEARLRIRRLEEMLADAGVQQAVLSAPPSVPLPPPKAEPAPKPPKPPQVELDAPPIYPVVWDVSSGEKLVHVTTRMAIDARNEGAMKLKLERDDVRTKICDGACALLTLPTISKLNGAHK